MAEGAEPSAEGGITFSEQCWNELLMLSALHQIRVRCITIHCSLSVNLQQVRSGPVRSAVYLSHPAPAVRSWTEQIRRTSDGTRHNSSAEFSHTVKNNRMTSGYFSN